MYILYRSWGWMCITSETCRAKSVIKTALNNLHQAGPNKTHIWWCMETQKIKYYVFCSGPWCTCTYFIRIYPNITPMYNQLHVSEILVFQDTFQFLNIELCAGACTCISRPCCICWHCARLCVHYYNHTNHLIIWCGWTHCDLVSFVADMGQQSSWNLLVLNEKWSSCECTVFTGQETFFNWRVCRYVVLHAVAVKCFEYMYFFTSMCM